MGNNYKNLDKLNRYLARYKLVDKEPPFSFTLDKQNNIWLTGINIEGIYDTYTVRIPEFTYGISLGKRLLAQDSGNLTLCEQTILGSFDTIIFDGQNIPLVGSLQSLCCGLKARRVEFINFDAEQIRSAGAMFMNSTVTEIDFSGLKTRDLRYIQMMFSDCKNIEVIDLRSLDLRQLRDMQGAFQFCYKLREVYLPPVDSGNLRQIQQLCWCDTNLVDINCENLKSNKIQSAQQAFDYCGKLKVINLGNIVFYNNSVVEGILANTTELAALRLQPTILKYKSVMIQLGKSLCDQAELVGIVIGNKVISLRDTDTDVKTLADKFLRIAEVL